MDVVTVERNEESKEIVVFDEQKAQEELKKRFSLAEETLKDEDAVEKLLQRIEKKLKEIRIVGEKLATVPIMVSLVRNFIRKEYTDIPIGSIIAILSALIYFVSPIDFIPDSIPFLGYFDDAAVVAACWQLVESDVAEYQAWREKNDKFLDI